MGNIRSGHTESNGRTYTFTWHYLTAASTGDGGDEVYVAAPIHLCTSSTAAACPPEFVLTAR